MGFLRRQEWDGSHLVDERGRTRKREKKKKKKENKRTGFGAFRAQVSFWVFC
jgi:hypothetical protein